MCNKNQIEISFDSPSLRPNSYDQGTLGYVWKRICLPSWKEINVIIILIKRNFLMGHSFFYFIKIFPIKEGDKIRNY